MVREKTRGEVWGVVEDPKWHMHVFDLYGLVSEELRSLTNLRGVWREQYSRETDRVVCGRLAVAQV